MTITRRALLGGCSMWAAVAAMPAALSVVASAKPKGTPLSESLFTSLTGASFQVKTGSSSQALTLMSVNDIAEPTPPPPPPQPTSFSLKFYGGIKQLKQGTYTFQNESTGQFRLFIVPSGEPLSYVAIFSHF